MKVVIGSRVVLPPSSRQGRIVDVFSAYPAGGNCGSLIAYALVYWDGGGYGTFHLSALVEVPL